MRTRISRPAGLATLVAAALVVAAGCDLQVTNRIAQDRAAAGRSPVATSGTLTESARAHAQQMCANRSATPSADPNAEFDAETAAAADDLAGSALLDPSLASDPVQQDVAATRAIVDGWAGNPLITDARWNNVGVGSVACDDGRLYYSAAFTQRPSMPATGRYSSPQYTEAQITRTSAIKYGSAVDYLGVPTDLLLDIWRPPAGVVTNRPLIVLIHGGAFAGGSRNDYTGVAIEFAVRGFVVASIDYRLRPTGGPERELLGASDAIDDGMESIRWLKSNAATYGIDTTRIGAVGSSAGAVVALGLALADDATPTGPLAGVSPSVQAGVSTGGTLTPGLSLIHMQADDPAVLMFNHEFDEAVGPADDAFKTCAAARASGNTCDFVEFPGDGHTTYIYPSSQYWAPTVGPFLWQHLRLGT